VGSSVADVRRHLPALSGGWPGAGAIEKSKLPYFTGHVLDFARADAALAGAHKGAQTPPPNRAALSPAGSVETVASVTISGGVRKTERSGGNDARVE